MLKRDISKIGIKFSSNKWAEEGVRYSIANKLNHTMVPKKVATESAIILGRSNIILLGICNPPLL